MRNIKTNTVILIISLFFMATSTAKTTTVDKDVSKIEAPLMQAGGYSNISNAKLQELLQSDALLVDIRRKEEWHQTGVISGSKTITFFDKAGQIDKNFLPQFMAIAKKDQPVILICRTGNRTKFASEAIAKQLGFTNVMNVTTGITGWIAEKRPVTKY